MGPLVCEQCSFHTRPHCPRTHDGAAGKEMGEGAQADLYRLGWGAPLGPCLGGEEGMPGWLGAAPGPVGDTRVVPHALTAHALITSAHTAPAPRFDTQAGKWAQLVAAGPTPPQRSFHTACIAAGKMYVSGSARGARTHVAGAQRVCVCTWWAKTSACAAALTRPKSFGLVRAGLRRLWGEREAERPVVLRL